MSGTLILTPRAQDDLDEIWTYTAKHWDLNQAENYIRMMWRDMQMTAATPGLGRARPEIRAGYYSRNSGSHIIFYRLTESGIDVARILHERMDFRRHLA